MLVGQLQQGEPGNSAALIDANAGITLTAAVSIYGFENPQAQRAIP